MSLVTTAVSGVKKDLTLLTGEVYGTHSKLLLIIFFSITKTFNMFVFAESLKGSLRHHWIINGSEQSMDPEEKPLCCRTLLNKPDLAELSLVFFPFHLTL